MTQLIEQVLAPLGEKLNADQAVENEEDFANEEENPTASLDEWDNDFDFENEEDAALLDEALAEEQESVLDKNIKIAIVGRPKCRVNLR